ncbi:MAG: glutamine--fructose-6-phosphate transaminase (isomerizing), partial [Pseudomonadota bacterium]
MCGIIGINSENIDIVESVVNGLKNLEYRGYDSAGISAIVKQKFKTIKVKGKISILDQEINSQKLSSNIAIGHTRWATHGAANQTNAHPHCTEGVSVVHNGIIENFLSIKKELQEYGCKFTSDTDSEVIPHLITFYLDQGLEPLEATHKTVQRLEGAFSIAAIFLKNPDIMIAARKGSPLVIGYGDKQTTIASDAYSLAFLSNKISYLEEGDMALLTSNSIKIYNPDLKEVSRKIVSIDNNNINLGKGNFRHYMLKEIFEQPSILADTISAYYDAGTSKLNFTNLDIDFKKVTKITLVACGTSYYASMVAKYWLENLLSIQAEIEIASEFRYRNSYLPENGLAIFLSQSGETADTLAALRHAKQKKQITLSIVNVKESSIDRESDYSLECFAGPEI